MKFFITATDTDIGKTFVTTSLLKAFLDANFNAIALKPVQTGCEIVDNKAIAPDLNEYQKVNPKNDFAPRYAFKFPASPHFSANLENERINMGELEIYVNKYAKNAEITLVEGAGGLFVPLNEDEIFLDFIKILQIPVVLVCKNVLGSINHTLLNIEILRQNGIKIALLVVNFHDENNKIAKSNLEYLRSKFDGEIAVLPKFENENYEKASEFFANFVQNCSKNLLNSDEIIDLEFDKNHLWHPYTSALHPLGAYGVKFVKGNKIYTDNGVLIDGMSSWWCATLGYNRSELNAAANTQISRFSHIMFGGLTHAPAVNLGKKLLEMMSEFSHIFYCDSGSVSVEVALKMALQYQQNKNPQKTKILTVLGGYHGDTIGAMSVCDPINGMHFLFNGILAEQIFAPRPSCRFDEPFDESSFNEFEKIFMQNNEKIAAVIIEPIVQGAGGMWFYHPRYLEKVRELCDKFGALLIFDEVATGFGRTGKMFAYNHTKIAPDIITIGKALTGGFMSFAATLANEKVARGISENGGVFMHGPTFMANPLACVVALKNLQTLTSINWQEKVLNLENSMKQNLSKCAKFDEVSDIRVLGGIGVVELKSEINVEKVQKFFVSKGVFIRPFGKNIYLMPPFITPDDDLKVLCDAVYEAIKGKYFV